MPSGSEGRGRSWRWVRLLGVALAVTLGVLILIIGPDLPGFLPWQVERWLDRWGPFWTLIGLLIVLIKQPTRFGCWSIAGTFWTNLDRACAWCLAGPLTWVVGAGCLIALLGWVPHYLTWPWWCDSDQFAVSALAWNSGLRPYRDLPDFDFPGPIYLFWIIGRLVGWGRTWPVYAVDAATVFLWGAALWIWSRRRFQSALPGLLAYAAFLWYYLGLDYSLVAQRDWRAPLLISLGILALQTWPGRMARVGSAFALAAALTVRPQAVLLVPAMVAALLENAASKEFMPIRPANVLLDWAAWLALGLLLAWAPIICSGAIVDFVHVVSVARYGSSYNRVTLESFARALPRQLIPWKTSWLLAAIALLSVAGPADQRRTTRTWLIAFLGVLFYKPLSPVAHGYLNLPRELIWSVNAGLFAAWLLHGWRFKPSARLVGLVVLLIEVVPTVPAFWSPRASLRSIPYLVNGTDPIQSPPGCRWGLPDPQVRTPRPAHCNWSDYRSVLQYLRSTTDETTLVANVLRTFPFPSINGPVGRLTPFPAAAGVMWLASVEPRDESRFAESLRNASHTVVVWAPRENDQLNLRLDQIVRVIEQDFEMEARFGFLEVWRKKPALSGKMEAPRG